MGDEIGSVAWPGGSPVATLHSDGRWSVPGEEWQEGMLRLAYSDAWSGPADGPFGPGALAALAEAVGGTVAIRPRGRAPADAAY